MRAKKIWELNCRGEEELKVSDVEYEVSTLEALVLEDVLEDAQKELSGVLDEDDIGYIMGNYSDLVEFFRLPEDEDFEFTSLVNVSTHPGVIILIGEEVRITYVEINPKSLV